MKLLGMLLSVVVLNHSHPLVTLVDINLKKPISQTNDFTVENYMSKQFPVYSEDTKEVNNSIDRVVRLLDDDREFNWDSVKAGHSVFVLKSGEENYKRTITVRIMTHLQETGMWFNFELVKKEANIRKAQRKLLDFASYLTKEK